MKTAMVTGGSGFVGGHLVNALLARGVEVRCLTRAASTTDRFRRDGVSFLQGDVLDPARLRAAVAGVDVVLHVAGLTKSLSNDELMRVNCDGTRNVAAACAAMPTPPTMVVVSSVAAAGTSIGGRPREETDVCCPVSNYGRSKRAGELAAAEFSDRVPITVIRPPFVFGGGDAGGLHLFRMIHRYGIHPVPRMRRRHRISLIHAADLAEGIWLAVSGGSRVDVEDKDGQSFRQGCYFVCCDRHPRYSQLGNLIGAASGRRFVLKIPSPGTIVKLVGAANDGIARRYGRGGALSLDKAREATAGSWECSPQRIQQELGFAPTATLEQRLQETVDWYHNHGWL